MPRSRSHGDSTVLNALLTRKILRWSFFFFKLSGSSFAYYFGTDTKKEVPVASATFRDGINSASNTDRVDAS